MTVAETILCWGVASVFAGVILGRFIKWGTGDE